VPSCWIAEIAAIELPMQESATESPVAKRPQRATFLRGAIDSSPLVRYGLAAAIAAAAILIRLALDPVWGVKLPYITLFPAIMLSGWLGGFGPGLATTLFSAIAAEYFWIAPAESWAVADRTELFGLFTFVAVGALISGLNESWRRSVHTTAQATEDLRRLQTITDAALASLDSNTLIRELLGRVRDVLMCDAATMLLVDSTGTCLTAVASDGIEDVVDPQIRIQIGEGIAGQIASRDEPTIIDDVRSADIVNPILRERLKSLVGVPLKVDGRLFGVIHAGSVTPRRFSSSDVRLLSLAADRIALALERAQLHDTERTARAAAERSTEQLRVALEAGRMGTWEYSVRTGNVKWSHGLEVVHGYPPGTFPGTFDAFREEIHSEDRERVVEAINEAVRQGRDHHVEYRIVRRDGEVRWVEGRGQLFLDEDGAPDHMVGVCLDATERHLIEVERAQLLGREQAARADIERASRLKDEFLAVLSHELRTPLNAVLGYAQLLDAGALAPERTRHAIGAIRRNAEAQARLVGSLLDLSRIMAGKLELDLERLDISTLIETAVDVVRPDADAKGISVDVSVPTDAPGLMGDAGRLQQVFGNLLSNAIKFTPRDGRVTVAVLPRDTELEIAIADTGQGISAEFLPYVFDRFKQGEILKGRATAGLGLGLALVREMVSAHKGTVVAESRGEGRGSTFTVRLPATDAAPAPPTTGETAVESLRGLNILIVDDDGDVRDLLGLLLESRAATARSASSVAEALTAIGQRRPDVLLADLGMPEEDGYSLIRKIRADEGQQHLPRLPAIAVTAYAAARDRDQALSAGYDWHVAKPVDPDGLARAITNVVKIEEV
jgi:PAS domain S-box-containing protein